MIARLLLLCLLATPALAVHAASKADPKAKPAAEGTGLSVTPKALQAGMQSFIKEEADCRSVTFGSVRTLKNGAQLRQKLQREDAEVDMALDVSKAGKVSNLRFAADTKDPAHLTVMLCATYAAMRTLQPMLENRDIARQAALQLWQDAQQKTVTKEFYNERFRAQMAPFELNAF